MHRASVRGVALLMMLVCTIACGPGEPLRVSTIQTGRSLNSDNSINAHTTQFRPDDTMYVSVITAGPGSGTLLARWTYAGRLVSETTRDVSYNDQAATEFHIQNSGGFPPGEYKVEIFVDGMSVGSRTLRVEK